MGYWLNRLASWYQRRTLLNRPWQQLRYVALDIETNGLDPKQHDILAIAWLSINPPLMDIGDAEYHIFPADHVVLGQSPVIHGLTRTDFTACSAPKQVLQQLAIDLQNAVLVCHHRRLDWAFLQSAAKHYGISLKPLAIFDTLAFEQQRLQRQPQYQHGLPPALLTLSACRDRYLLPQYTAHNALDDAIACAELFLAEVYQAADENAQVGQLLRRFFK